MAEKILNTRIQLKRDTLTNWNESTLVLKPGELAVAYVDVATRDAKGNIVHVPTAVLKAGENVEGSTKTFKELPFVSAIAADVYAWAKEAGFYVETVGEGEAIAGIEFKATETHPNGALVVTKTDLVTPTELTDALSGYYTKGEIDALIAGLSVGALEDRIEAVETAVTTTLPGQIEAVDAKFADYTKTTDLPKDLGDFTNNAGYAKTADVNTELNKKADKTQVATDIASAIAPLATVEALNGVKATAEAATTVEEVDDQIDTKISALNLGTTYEPIGAETRAKDYVDQKFTDANLAQYTTEQEVKDIVDGVIAGAADDETYNSLTKLVDYIDAHGGEAANMAEAIETLEGKVQTIEGKPAYGITATQVTNWDGEVGAKAAAEAAQKTADDYATAHAGDYTNKQIDDAIDADVKAAIDAEILRANGAYDAKGAAADAQAAAIADAADKYETKGTAQGIVNGLNLAGTYEPIGAESRAIAAAKTETENQIAALNVAQYAKDADLAAIAKSGNVNDLVQTEGDVLVFDCGTSTLVI